jgi:hypothetical protein
MSTPSCFSSARKARLPEIAVMIAPSPSVYRPMIIAVTA